MLDISSTSSESEEEFVSPLVQLRGKNPKVFIIVCNGYSDFIIEIKRDRALFLKKTNTFFHKDI